MVARALLRNSVSIEEWLAATTFVKCCTLKKRFPAINYKEKCFLGTTTLLWIAFFSYESLLIISHHYFFTSVSKCSSTLFQHF